MSQINSYRDLLVWSQAMDLTADVYKVTRDIGPVKSFMALLRRLGARLFLLQQTSLRATGAKTPEATFSF